MNDNDVDDLARVLAEHWENPSEFIHAFCHVMAAAVLASGVVVSARDHERTKEGARTLGQVVKAQCDMALDATGLHHLIDEDGDGDWGAVWEHLAEMGERHRASLLREPATDAAPDGEHVCADCPDCIHNGNKCCGCYDGFCCRDPESGHQSAPDATEPADPHPSDPQPTTGPQEDAQP